MVLHKEYGVEKGANYVMDGANFIDLQIYYSCDEFNLDYCPVSIGKKVRA